MELLTQCILTPWDEKTYVPCDGMAWCVDMSLAGSHHVSHVTTCVCVSSKRTNKRKDFMFATSSTGDDKEAYVACTCVVCAWLESPLCRRIRHVYVCMHMFRLSHTMLFSRRRASMHPRFGISERFKVHIPQTLVSETCACDGYVHVPCMCKRMCIYMWIHMHVFMLHAHVTYA